MSDGDERLVLEGALSPEALPDGSLLLIKLNAEGRFQLHRFWPETGRLQALPLRVSQDFYLSAPIRADAEDVQIVGGLEHMHHIPMDAGIDLNPKLTQNKGYN